MAIDALYAFPEAKERVVALGNAQQGPRGFIPLIEPRYDEITILENEVGAEQVAAERPDLVILKTIVKEDLGDPLESIGIPVVYVNFETPEQYTNDLQILGEALQNTARAQELIDYYAAQQDEIVAATAGLADEQKPRVLLLYYNDRDGEVAFNVPPLSYIQSTLIQQAGGLPVWQDIELGKGWTKVGFEQIAAWDPDQVYLVAYTRDADQVVAELQADPQWQALRAAQEGQLYPVPNDFYSWDQPDTRWALGLRWLASKIQPELFPQIDTLAEARQFYQFAYGLDEAAFDSQVLPLLTELEAVND
jgi:iron complex transport system substrate-binding protein